MNKVLFSVVIWALLTATASAATLSGKVVEVSDGDTITITNLNRLVKVRILGVDAPDAQQPFADVAKQHLSDLILTRFVSVEYSGLVQHNYLLGKVFYRDNDIGAQMLRDGVAWFDKTTGRLSDVDRQIYSQCEQAARAEHRGLWQDANPIAPWDFKEQEAARVAAAQPSLGSGNSGRKGPMTLGSEDLLQGFPGLGSDARVTRSATGTDNEWRRLAPAGKNFSVQVPGVGYETSVNVPAGTGTANLNYWVGEYDRSLYMLMWSRGPNLTYTDSSAIEDMANGLVSGLNRGLEKRGIGVEFNAKLQRNLKLNGYTGGQFTLSAGSVTGVLRAFSKQFGDEREMYIVSVLNSSEENPSAQKFLNSFTFDRKK